MMEVYWIQINK